MVCAKPVFIVWWQISLFWTVPSWGLAPLIQRCVVFVLNRGPESVSSCWITSCSWFSWKLNSPGNPVLVLRAAKHSTDKYCAGIVSLRVLVLGCYGPKSGEVIFLAILYYCSRCVIHGPCGSCASCWEVYRANRSSAALVLQCGNRQHVAELP